MSTEKQIEANQRNGWLSNGPVTGEGKVVSSRNALKHGLLLRQVLLPSEDRRALAGLEPKGYAAAVPAESRLVYWAQLPT